ncbi:YopX family protein [Streptococcus hohhotensis]
MIPKYRAWHKTWDELGKVKRIRFDGEGNVTTVLFEGKFLGVNTHVDEIELMQSTDMVDRDGKIIFEGDIVKMSKDVYSEPNYYEVVRHRGGAYRLESKQHGCELWLRHTDCEVVGNVYENKELLDA